MPATDRPTPVYMTPVTDAAGPIWLVKLRLEESHRALLAATKATSCERGNHCQRELDGLLLISAQLWSCFEKLEKCPEKECSHIQSSPCSVQGEVSVANG